MFVGELKSLETLHLSENDSQIDATLDFLVKGYPRLSNIVLLKMTNTPEPRAHLKAFEAKLFAENPNAEVFY